MDKYLNSLTDDDIHQIFSSSLETLNEEIGENFSICIIDSKMVHLPINAINHNHAKDYPEDFLVVRYFFAKDEAALEKNTVKEEVVPNVVFLSDCEVVFVPDTESDLNCDLFEPNTANTRYVLDVWSLALDSNYFDFLWDKIGRDRLADNVGKNRILNNIPVEALPEELQKYAKFRILGE